MEVSTYNFDIDLLAIIERKKDLSVNLKYAEMTILSMYEELQIVRESESAEDDLKKRVKELGKTVEVFCLQLFNIFVYIIHSAFSLHFFIQEADQLVSRKEAELVKRTKAVQRANAQLKSIQEMIENELADNKHCEYLLKVFMMRDTGKSKKANASNKHEKSVAGSTSTIGK